MLKTESTGTKDDTYRYATPPSPWQPIDPGSGDAAYQFPADGAVLGVNSACGQELELPLERLTENALVGLSQRQDVDQRPVTVDHNPALRTLSHGVVDGEPYTMVLTVVRSRSCVYDFSLVTKGKDPTSHVAAYDRFVASFGEAH